MNSHNFKHGDRVSVFNSRLYINDLETPLSVTMCPATVLRQYIYDGRYNDIVVDVIFDGEERESKAHFVNYIKFLN